MNLLERLKKESTLKVKDLRPSTTKDNCYIATLEDGTEAYIHNDAVTTDGWSEPNAEGCITHPELKKFTSRRADGSDLWLTFELPQRSERKASTELAQNQKA